MKTPKSAAEAQAEDALKHIEVVIQNQNVKIADAQYLSRMVAKVLYKCEELRLSRDKWRIRAERAESQSK